VTLSYGFFNSIGEDRVYDATHFSRYLEGIISNGCFPNSTGFKVIADGSALGANPPSVIISPGKAYYNGMWVHNDANLQYFMGTGQQANPNMVHLLYFCFDTNNTSGGRKVEILCTTSANPTIPADGSGKYYMPLARVLDWTSGGPSQPLTAAITDQRTNAGVNGINVDTAGLIDGAVTTNKLAASAVTAAKLGTSAVTDVKINTGAVTTAKIATDAITTVKIANGQVTGDKLAADSVTTTKLADGAVTAAKIVDLNIIGSKIAEGAVDLSKMGNQVLYSNTAAHNSTLSSSGTQSVAAYVFTFDPVTDCTLFMQGACTVWSANGFYADIIVTRNGSTVARFAGTNPGGNPNNRICIPWFYSVNLVGADTTQTITVTFHADSGTMTFAATGYPASVAAWILPR